MNRTQRRAGQRAQRRSDARMKEAKRRDVDRDLPLYLKRDLGRLEQDNRVDQMPPIIRTERFPRD